MSVRAAAPGKIILIGEHAVVHGEPALAAALPFGLELEVETRDDAQIVLARTAGIDDPRVAPAVRNIADTFGLRGVTLSVETALPVGGGLGSSAAFSVALVRALSQLAGRSLSAEEVGARAAIAERTFHGTPSGVDHTTVAHGGIGLFRRGPPLEWRPVRAARKLPIVIGLSGRKRQTRANVATLAERLRVAPERYRPLLARLGELAGAGATDVSSGALEALGARMDEAHALLSECGVSCAELDAIVSAARRAGALGAKLTGAGGGGAAIALVSDPAPVEAAIRASGFETRFVEIG